MKSFYEFWKTLENRRTLMEFQATGGAVSQDTNQGGGMSAASTPAQLPTQGPPNQQAPEPPGNLPPSASEPGEFDNLAQAVDQTRDSLKANKQDPAYDKALKQLDVLATSLKALQTNFENEKTHGSQTMKQDKQASDNQAKQNAPLNQKPAAVGGPTSGLATQMPSPPQPQGQS